MKVPTYYSKKNVFIFILILVFLVSWFLFFSFKKTTITVITATDTLVLDVVIADTPKKQMQGLMFRTELAENEGMLFVFDKPDKRHFWMKNTYLPLDIIFIDENKTILQIEHVDPCAADPCSIYSSNSNAVAYVLETNQNVTLENNVVVGNKISLN